MGADSERSVGGNDDELTPGHGADPQTERRSPAQSQEKSLAELARDVAGLEEVCRWQWNLVQRLRGHVDSLTGRR